jgi:TPP-dependent pyruvate/acetoin dehydrogenase alpha subunit
VPTPDSALLEQMFHRMAVARSVERLLMQHTRDHKFSGWWHPGEGQEAAPIGATAAMLQDDYLWYQGRGAAWAIGKGMDPAPILGDLLGKMSGATRGKGGGVPHWADYSLGIMGEGATLGSVYPLAGGSALASKIRKDGRVSLANFGDGTSARGTFHETMMHAAAWKLPLIYFCENNGLLVGTRLEAVSPTANIADLAQGYHIPGITVDGQDAVAVYEVTREAIVRARRGEGPTLIEARIWRINAHTSEDNQARYRDAEEVEEAGRHDPLVRFESWLEDRGWLTAEEARAVRERLDREAAEAADWAETQPDPRPEDLATPVYGT